MTSDIKRHIKELISGSENSEVGAKNDKRLKGLKDVDYYKEGGIYKYTYGASPDYNKVLRSKRSITDKFKDAFIIAFKNGEKINVNTAISEFKKNRNK